MEVGSSPYSNVKVLFSVIGVVSITLLIYMYYDVSPADVGRRDAGLSLESLDGRASHSGTWFSMKKELEIYAYTAFYDDRQLLGGQAVIRVIAVCDNRIEKRGLYCAMSHTSGRNSSRVDYSLVKPLAIGAGVNRHGVNFREYVLTCKLQRNAIPSTVSLVHQEGDAPTFHVPVEIPLKPPVKEDFVVCVSVTFWKVDPYRVVEWMELHRIWGVNKVTVYNNSIEDDSARVFQHYAEEGFVDFRNSHSFVSDAGELTILLHMSPVINDCMYRNMHAYKKVVVTDLDEMIVPRKHMNYTEMLADLHSKYQSTHPARSFTFRNMYFFFELEGEDTSQSEHLMTLRHRKRLPASGQGYSAKSIIDPQACTNMHNHYCWGYTPLADVDGRHTEVEPELAANQHYKKCHLDKWENKVGRCRELAKEAESDDTMLRFKDLLVQRAQEQWQKLNLGR